ncbi:unnamed protein product, partial [Anisakis simplex]|uniref:DUF4005 domain-containing protein n=1 Tax=Anisakis simplex TaxID=6269 RepID=A0A0M3JN17_ANISI
FRDTAERKQTIVFDRPNLPSAPNQRHTSSTGRRMAIVDYEDDIDTDNADGDKATNRDYSISSFSGRHNRKRHRHSPNHAFKPNASSSSSLVFIFVAMYISQR